jgi:alpha-D-ribose 1-methylphosphonate 5-triphosphate diphosphatase
MLMGAPNVVRGKSHSGNVSATDLVRAGLLDILSSDYVPFALLQAGFALPQRVEGLALPRALAMVTANPARAAGLDDRGSIAPGKRADLVRVRVIEGLPVVRGVWRQGRRVC